MSANLWIRGDITLTNHAIFEDQTRNLIVFGNIKSNFDITINVNNLILFGSIITTKNINLGVKSHFFKFGSLGFENCTIISAGTYRDPLNDEVIEKIKALGINLSR